MSIRSWLILRIVRLIFIIAILPIISVLGVNYCRALPGLSLLLALAPLCSAEHCLPKRRRRMKWGVYYTNLPKHQKDCSFS